MDLVIFFLVSYPWFVGASVVVIPYDRCNNTFLLSIGRGSLSSEYTSAAAATCEMYWLNRGWHNNNVFVGLNITQGCPAMNHCSKHKNWTYETLPVTNSPEYKHICETGSTGCCEKNSIANVRNCTSFNLYFHRTSKGCDKDYCFVNGPHVMHTPGKSTSGAAVVLPINTRNGTILSGHTTSASQINKGKRTNPNGHTTLVVTQINMGNRTNLSGHTTSVVLPTNTGNGTTLSGQTTSVSPIKTGSGTNRSDHTSLARVPVWSICLITISIASNIFLTLGLVFLWLKNKRRTHAAADIRTENTEVIKIGNRIK